MPANRWRLGRHTRRGFLYTALALLPAATPAGAQTALSQEHWINIDDAPEWISGTRPDLELARGWRGVRLQPGTYTVVRVPPRSDLRLVNSAGTLQSMDLDIALSDGSGLLYGVATPKPDGAGHLVVARALDERLVRITRADHHTDALDVAMFTSRFDRLNTLHRRVVPINGNPVTVRRAPRYREFDFWPIGAPHAGELVVEGPTHLVIDTLVAPTDDLLDTSAGYRVHTELDEVPAEVLEFPLTLNGERSLVNGKEVLLGTRQNSQLAVPPGRHRVRLYADAEVYARVSAFTPDQYLLRMNAPAPATLEPAIEPGSHWTLAPTDIAAWARGTVAQRERAALRLARDNHYRGSGLLAAHLLEQTALAFPANPRLATLAGAFTRRYTSYRQLLPRPAQTTLMHRFYWFATPARYARIADLVGNNPKTRQLALASLDHGQFYDLRPGAELSFAIPPRSGASRLRVAVVATPGTQPAFRVQFDDAPAIPVDGASLAPEGAVAFDTPSPTRLDDEAVAALTLLPPFASSRRPARLVRAARVELPLRVDARTVTVKGASTPLKISVHYRGSRRFTMTEAEHADALKRVGPYGSFEELKRLFYPQRARDVEPAGYAIQLGAFGNARNVDALVSRLKARSYPVRQENVGGSEPHLVRVSIGPYEDRDAALAALDALRSDAALDVSGARLTAETDAVADLDEDLASHRVPLVRWLKSRHINFRKNAPAPRSPAARASSDPDLTALAEQARRLEADGAWSRALASWRQVADSDARALRKAALDGQYRSLTTLGETRLATALLRDAFHNDNDPAIREYARVRLTEHYADEGDPSALEMLVAAAALETPGVATLHSLIEHLVDSGRAHEALTLALAMPPWDRPYEALVAASALAGWWQTFEATLPKLDDPRQQWWLGYRAQTRGDFAAARTHWHRAGAPGARSAAALNEGLRIRDRLAAGSTASARAWADWQDAMPGGHRWVNASHLLYASAGGAVLHWPAIDGYRQTFAATPGHPVRLRVRGPQQVEIQARVVHTEVNGSVIDDWLEIRDRGNVTRLPIERSRPRAEIEIVGDAQRKPSRVHRFIHAVGPGDHDLTVNAAGVPLLLQVYTRRPNLPLTVLPSLTNETLTALGASGAATPELASAPSTAGVFADTLLTRVALYQPDMLARDHPVLEVAVDDRAAIRRMTEWVRRIESEPAAAEFAIAEAERWYAMRPDPTPLKALKARLDRYAAWELVRNVRSSAGARWITIDGWRPENPKLKVRKALSTPVANDEQIVSTGHELGATIVGDLVSRVELRLAIAAPEFAPIEPMTAYYTFDDGPRRRVELRAGAAQSSQILPISAAQHSLKVGIENPPPGQQLRVRLRDADRGRPLVVDQARRLYHVATRDEPVRITLKGPAWLRIHRRRGDTEAHEFRYLGAGWQTLALTSAPGVDQTLFRVFRRVKAERSDYLPPQTASLSAPLPPFPTAIPSADPTPRHVSDSELIRHRKGGWTIYGAAVDRRNVDEDLLGASERFGEFGAVHRARPTAHTGTFFRTTVLGRLRERGGPTLGVRERIDLRGSSWPVDIRLDADLTAQRPGGTLTDVEWSARVQAQASRSWTLNHRTRHRPRVRVFARYLSLDEDEIDDPSRVDQDVFSRYKGDHRYGLSFGDTVTHEPWADARWYAAPLLTTNEDLDPFDPDYIQARAGWTQLLRDWVVDARYQFRHYFADADRDSASDRHQFRLAVDWDPLRTLRHWHLDFSWIHDFSSADNSLRFTVGRDIGGRNTTREYYPGEVRFRRVRRQLAAYGEALR